MVKVCKNCLRYTPKGFKFCPLCGTKLLDISDEEFRELAFLETDEAKDRLERKYKDNLKEEKK